MAVDQKKFKGVRIALAIVTAFSALFAFAGCRKPQEEPPIVEVKNVDLYISMQENAADEDWTDRIRFEGLSELNATTLADIPADLTQGIGDKSDRTGRKYFAFSYYLYNHSERAISYEMCVNIERSTGTILNALRVLVVEGDKKITQGDIYAKPETTDEGRKVLEDHTDYETQPFESDKMVCKRSVSNFAQNTKVKHTLLVWIEGWDIDCNETMLASSVRMNISITGA